MKKHLLALFLLTALCFTLVSPALAAVPSFDLSSEGLGFISRHETFRSTAYSADGKWYIGYGTACAQNAYPDGISQAQGMQLLRASMTPHVEAVNAFLQKNNIRFEQQQFDAMLSFTCSLGAGWTTSSSNISTYLKEGFDKRTETEIVDAMALWCHSGGQVVDAYLQRRIDEARLFLYGDYSAKSAKQYYALILDTAGGTVLSDTACYPASAPYGKLPTVTRSGFDFDGWYTQDGEKLSPDATPSAHTRLTAKWTLGAALGFADVSSADWFYTYVYDLTRSGVIHGRTATSFAPAGTLTHAEALKLILLAAGHPAQSSLGGHWADGYASFAVKQGYLSTAPANLDANINRLEIAQLANRALGLAKSSITSPFSDTRDAAVLALYEAGIVKGSTENNSLVYKPSSYITRAEISAVIWRMERYDGKPVVDNTPQPKPEPAPEPKPDPKPEPPDHSQQFQYKGQWLDIFPNVPKNPYDAKLFYQANGFTHYRSNDYRYETGVDVSIYQGDIDWHKVKASGIDFAIIRAGGRGWGAEGNIYADKNFKKNMEGALAADLKVGVYFFSQAITAEEAIEEARYTLDMMKGYKITYPVVFDWEIVSNKGARTANLSAETLSAAANAFCRTVEQAGHHPMIYFNSPCGYLRYDLSKIVEYDFWYAQYYSVPTFFYGFDMWQYTSSGEVPGIPGRVDLNLYWLPK